MSKKRHFSELEQFNLSSFENDIQEYKKRKAKLPSSSSSSSFSFNDSSSEDEVESNVCPACHDEIGFDYSFICTKCKKIVCLDCATEHLEYATLRTDVMCTLCDRIETLAKKTK